MLLQQVYDSWPLPGIFAGIIIILFLSAEAGFLIGKVRANKLKDENSEDKQAGSIMGASLGLLAFLLAFTFSMASSIHTERKTLVLEEANAIGTLYLRSDLLAAETAEQVRGLIRDYVDIRLLARTAASMEDVVKIKTASEDLLEKLWATLIEATKANPQPTNALVINALNSVFDLHAKRVNAVYKRLPEIVSFTLIIIAVITLGLMGYQSGLNGVRVLVPRFALIVSLASVMLLVVDLDRPGGALIKVGQEMMSDLQQQIAEKP